MQAFCGKIVSFNSHGTCNKKFTLVQAKAVSLAISLALLSFSRLPVSACTPVTLDSQKECGRIP